MDKIKVQQIKDERIKLNHQISNLKMEIEKLNPASAVNIKLKSKDQISNLKAASILYGVAAVLGIVIGGCFGAALGNVLVWLLASSPIPIVSIIGISLSLNEIRKLKKLIKANELSASTKTEIDKKQDEIEKLETRDHELYIELKNELAKSKKGLIKEMSNHNLTVPAGYYGTIDEYGESLNLEQ